MKDIIKRAERACLLEIIAIPVFLWTYSPDKVIFWILLILLDSYLMKEFDVISTIKLIATSNVKPYMKRLAILQIGFMLCLVVVAFKNLPLAGYLLLNDLVIDFASFFFHMKSQEK